MKDYDCIIYFSFGGPTKSDEVIPFLKNVTKGRNIPEERLNKVAEQYMLFGGKSPINDQNKKTIELLEKSLLNDGIELPIFFGNRNWEPFIGETLLEITQKGYKHPLVFVTSAYSSYSGCRQYLDDLERARIFVSENGLTPPDYQKIRLFYNHPNFIKAWVESINQKIFTDSINPDCILFSAHSIPLEMASKCDYELQLKETANLIYSNLEIDVPYHMVYQSRSGNPSTPWLTPDINDKMADLAKGRRIKNILVAPIGFISDHMEIIFDLDTQAKATAEELGITLHRAATISDSDYFVEMITQLIQEELVGQPPLAIGKFEPWPNICPDNHCVYR